MNDNYNKDTIEKIGHVLRMRRYDLRLSQDQLAKKAKMHRSYISGIENGSKNISIGMFLRMSDALDIEPEKVLRYASKK
jgi:transcriptional regulator with XRE-family HTH domain